MAQRLVRAKRKIKLAGYPVPGPAGASAPRATRRGPRGRLPDLQRGLRRSERPRGGGHLARSGAGRADARPARGARPPGDDAAARLPPDGTVARRRAGAPRRPGPFPVGRGPDRRGAGRARPGARARRTGPVRGPGRDRVGHADEPRDWRHIAVLYGELGRLTGSPVVELNRAAAVAEADGPGGRRCASSTRSSSTTTGTCTPPGPSCSAASGAPTRRAPRTPARPRSSSTTTPSDACSSAGSPPSDTDGA